MRSLSRCRLTRLAAWSLLCLTLLVCASCFTAAVPKGAVELESPANDSASDYTGRVDEKLIAVWELKRHLDASGKERIPDKDWNVVIEFTTDGKVLFRKADKSGGAPRSRTGTYAPAGNALVITDDEGRKKRWDYEISGNTLTVTWPQIKQKFIFERSK